MRVLYLLHYISSSSNLSYTYTNLRTSQIALNGLRQVDISKSIHNSENYRKLHPLFNTLPIVYTSSRVSWERDEKRLGHGWGQILPRLEYLLSLSCWWIKAKNVKKLIALANKKISIRLRKVVFGLMQSRVHKLPASRAALSHGVVHEARLLVSSILLILYRGFVILRGMYYTNIIAKGFCRIVRVDTLFTKINSNDNTFSAQLRFNNHLSQKVVSIGEQFHM